MVNLRSVLNTEEKQRLFSNFFSLTVLQAFTFILPLLTLPYLVRVLGSEKFGIVMFAQSFIMFFNIFVDYGFNLGATREVSIYREDKDKLTEIFSSVMMIKFVLLGVSFVALTIVVFYFDKFSSDKELYYLTFLWVIGQAMFPIWYFQGIEKMKYITIVNIVSKLIFTIAIFVFIHSENDFILVPVLNGLGFIIGGALSLWIIYKDFGQKFKFQKINTLLKYLQESSQFFLSRLSSVGYSNLNTFLIGVILTPQLVTYYYLADKIITVTLSIFDPLIQTIYPYLSKKFNMKFFIKLISFIAIVSVAIVIILFFLSGYISVLLLKENNQIFINTIYILLALIPISIIYVFMGAPLLLARGYKREFNLSIIYGFVLHIIILFCLYVMHNFFIMDNNILYFFAISLVVSKLSVLFIRTFYVYKYQLYKG